VQDLKFGQHFTDHLFIAEHVEGSGWGRPQIRPFSQGIILHPAAQVLHYGMCCFEGMKAYLGVDGRGRLFRYPSLCIDLTNACSCTWALCARHTTGEAIMFLPDWERGPCILLFVNRPDLNMQRIYRSSRRLMLADYDSGGQWCWMRQRLWR
jgi:branched-chain amino acid aminotransferase